MSFSGHVVKLQCIWTVDYDSTIKRSKPRHPGVPVVKSLPAKAGDTTSVFGSGGFHMPLGSCTRVLEPVLRTKRSHRSEKPTRRDSRVAPSPHTWGEPVHSDEDPVPPPPPD